MAIQSIGIDIREATEKGAGKGRYTLELTKALIAAAPNLDFYLYTKRPNPLLPSTRRVHQIVLSGRGPLWHYNLRRHLQKAPVDFFLSPTSFIFPALAPRRQKTALVVHDLIAFLHSKSHPWFPTLVERLTLPRALKKASLLISVSQHTQKDLLHLFSQAAKKPQLVLPPAVSAEIHPVATQKMDLPTDYLLTVGTLPRKNLTLVLEALQHIHTAYPTLHLCVAGATTPHTLALLKKLPKTLCHKIHLLGYVTPPQLCELYSRARIFIFPSLYEGFGIPPLEAMACGCPVIVSNATSLPEVVGRAALQVDPHEPAALAAAIQKLLVLKTALEYRQKGLRQAATFSWAASAQKLLSFLQNHS